MVSSTFADLREHRAALMKALNGQHLHAVAMEDDSARPLTVVESSLEKVHDSAAYIVIISRRYGAIPECGSNPAGLSLTHLEFREEAKLAGGAVHRVYKEFNDLGTACLVCEAALSGVARVRRPRGAADDAERLGGSVGPAHRAAVRGDRRHRQEHP